ncbi:MAG: hypothetical protein A2X94_16675 [Bdellovibrionales bacterium GWB1_55_8]|nr:MAG: hypothetical protein A2X94_16675 [Bdellovibrionales bacterium GWB1_55_8]
MRIQHSFVSATVLILTLCVSVLFNACSTASRSKEVNRTRAITQFVPYSVHFRRTPTKGADPYAGPGGNDYVAEKLPDARFDCEPLQSLFKDIDLDGVRKCLASISNQVDVLYRLSRDPAPAFTLDENESVPECLKKGLKEIPVPREIFFETVEESRPVCYAGRLNIEEDELFWVKLPIARKALRLSFPLDAPPNSDAETVLLLFSWAITPFWNDTPRSIPSVFVPDAVCDACLGSKNRLDPSAPPPRLWPY